MFCLSCAQFDWLKQMLTQNSKGWIKEIKEGRETETQLDCILLMFTTLCLSERILKEDWFIT